jgi:SagB-type dehydrogenase family enzyme
MTTRYRLSEGLVIELQEDGHLNLVIPTRRCRLRIGPGVVHALSEVARCTTAGDPITLAALGGRPELELLLGQLASLGMLSECSMDIEARSTNHDLLTLLERATLRMAQAGGCYTPALPQGQESPPRFQPMGDAACPLALPEPDVPRLINLWETIQMRRSRRTGPAREIPLTKLSTLLTYSLRIQTAAHDAFGEISFRPTASGGARHPVDAFLAALRVSQVQQGLYQYDPERHELRKLPGSPAAVESLPGLLVPAMGAAPTELPALTIAFACVPARTACKYQDNALLTIAKDVGCLIQQLYLVVQGLDLAGCAINGADAGQVEALLGLQTDKHAFIGGFLVW